MLQPDDTPWTDTLLKLGIIALPVALLTAALLTL